MDAADDDLPPGVRAAERLAQLPPEALHEIPGRWRGQQKEVDTARRRKERERNERREKLKNIQVYRPEGLRFPVDDERLERGIEAWLMGGTSRQVSAILGVETKDFEFWQQTRGFQALVDVFREPVRINVHARLTRLVSLTLAKIEERLDKGDAIVDSTGRVLGYKPIRLKDLDSLAATVVDKQIMVEKRLNGEADHTTALLPANVEELALRLRQMALDEKVVGEVKGDYHGPE